MVAAQQLPGCPPGASVSEGGTCLQEDGAPGSRGPQGCWPAFLAPRQPLPGAAEFRVERGHLLSAQAGGARACPLGVQALLDVSTHPAQTN